MSKLGDCPLVPVFIAGGGCASTCSGAKGFRAFDREGAEIGTFGNISVGTEALLELATDN